MRVPGEALSQIESRRVSRFSTLEFIRTRIAFLQNCCFLSSVPDPSSPSPSQQAAVAATKIRIRLKSFEVRHMAAACDKIIEAAKATEASISGPVPLPTKRRIYCVLRSPHVNKDSREHFETRTHHRLIDVHQPTAQTIDALMGLELPAGVEIEVKL
tara:strand:+ start:15180 stop:15650 length:471 start_codon:yes stop_codon:yes gene_type:complete